MEAIEQGFMQTAHNEKHDWLMAEKAYYLIQQKKMTGINKAELKQKIAESGNAFNLYQFIKKYT